MDAAYKGSKFLGIRYRDYSGPVKDIRGPLYRVPGAFLCEDSFGTLDAWRRLGLCSYFGFESDRIWCHIESHYVAQLGGSWDLVAAYSTAHSPVNIIDGTVGRPLGITVMSPVLRDPE